MPNGDPRADFPSHPHTHDRFLYYCIGIAKWIAEGKEAGSWMGFLTRATMETAQSYDQAQNMLSKTKLLAPAYFILGGNSSGQVYCLKAL